MPTDLSSHTEGWKLKQLLEEAWKKSLPFLSSILSLRLESLCPSIGPSFCLPTHLSVYIHVAAQKSGVEVCYFDSDLHGPL